LDEQKDRALKHLILIFSIHFYDFFMILEPLSKFKPSECIFVEIPRFQPLFPINTCRSAKMANKHLQGVPYYSICIVFDPRDLGKSSKKKLKSVPEKSKYGAASP
jgi:hypothetical protein